MKKPSFDDKDGFDEIPDGDFDTRSRRPKGGLLLILIFGFLLVALFFGTGSPTMSGREKISLSKFNVLLTSPECRFKEVTTYDDGTVDIDYIDEKNNEQKVYVKFDPKYLYGDVGKDTYRRVEEKVQEDGAILQAEEKIQWGSIVLNILPWIVLLFLIWFFFFRQMRAANGPGGVLSFGRSRAKSFNEENPTVSFDDVAGIDEARSEVQEIIMFLKNPKKFEKIGARIPRGVLLVGRPGTGKTLMAKAIAGEAKVPFYSISGSDFVEMFVGVGASRVRDLFRQARDNAPSIIFLDEIDAVGRRRGTGLGGGHDEREQTLNAILVEMDGFETSVAVIVIAATNRPDVLDPALLRPGRFDRQVTVPMPDVLGREEILKVHAGKVRMSKNVDLERIAKGTPGFSGADLEMVINEAAIHAVMKHHNDVEQEDLEDARDKVMWGKERSNAAIDETERKTTAFHEAGHAIVQFFVPEADPLYKVSVVPRGMALGITTSLPKKDKNMMTSTQLLSWIKILYGGRIGEELGVGSISTGASNDIKQATDIAKNMVCEWGMSEVVGPILYTEQQEHIFLGRDITRTADHSEATSNLIDQEIRRIIKECFDEAKRILAAHMDALERVALALLEFETIEGEEVRALVEGEDITEQMRKRFNERRKEKEDQKSRSTELLGKSKKSETTRETDAQERPMPGPAPA
ncbi:MAG: ATP-dependent zinc metalloprotease FtsH [Planctomycetes bacterium]|nr:ATP-dependent zinc metalloprotease FtsH [Planctomycetota bacterium]